MLIAAADTEQLPALRAAVLLILGRSCDVLAMEVAHGSTDPALDWGTETSTVQPLGGSPATGASLGEQPLGVDGTTWRAVVEAARRNRADVIVVSRERRPRWRRLLSGSFVHDLVDRAELPVLVVDPEGPGLTSRRRRLRHR